MRGWTTIVALSAVLMAYGCDTAPAVEEPVVEVPEVVEPPVGTVGDAAPFGVVELGALAEAPASYIGQTVTVVTDVEEVFGPRAFALDEDAFTTGGIDNDVIVLSPEAGSLAEIDDQWLDNKVRVTGTVGRMTVVDVEREIGWDLDADLEAEIERTGAIIMATSVERVEE